MKVKSANTQYFILGILNQQPRSGYDINQFLKHLSWLIGSPSFGSLYPALHALLDEKLVTQEVITHQNKPPRKVYSITEKGKKFLETWSNQPIIPSASLKSFVMRLLLGSNFSQPDLLAHLEQRRLQVVAHQAELEKAACSIDGTMDLGQQLTFHYGLALATAELTWLNNTLEQLSQNPYTTEVEKGDSAHV